MNPNPNPNPNPKIRNNNLKNENEVITLIFPTNFVCVHTLTVMLYEHSTDNNKIEYIAGENANTQN